MGAKLFKAAVSSLLFVFLSAHAFLGLASAQPSSFDPDTCFTVAGGKMFVRLSSGVALALEPSEYTLRQSRVPPSGPGISPEGCPGNPIVTKGISFPFRYTALLRDRSMSSIPDGRPDLLSIFGHDGPVNIQQRDLRLFERFKNLHEDCETVSSILEACRIRGTKDDGSKEDAGDSAAFFRAFPGEYFEFDGIPFAGSCRAPFHRGKDWSGRKCEFHYQMMAGLSVLYRVDDRRVPEEGFIAFDRALRAEILNARRPELDAPPAKAGN